MVTHYGGENMPAKKTEKPAVGAPGSFPPPTETQRYVIAVEQLDNVIKFCRNDSGSLMHLTWVKRRLDRRLAALLADEQNKAKKADAKV